MNYILNVLLIVVGMVGMAVLDYYIEQSKKKENSLIAVILTSLKKGINKALKKGKKQ